MISEIRSIYAEVFNILRGMTGRILFVHLVYVAMGLAVFTPLIGFMGRLLLHFSGQTMLSDMDIAFFALSPTGMTAVVLLGAMLITIIVFEQASLMALSAGSIQGEDVGVVPALRFTAGRAKDIFLFALHLVVRVLLIVLPFAAAGGAVAWFLLTDYDINYYLAEKPPAFLYAVVAIGTMLSVLAVVLIRKLLDWVMALPLVLLTDASAARSFADSTKLAAGRRPLLIWVFVLWGLAILLLEIALLGTVQFAGEKMLMSVKGSLAVLVLFLGAVVALLFLGSFFITALSSGSFASLLLVMSQRRGLHIDRLHLPAGQESRQGEKVRSGVRNIAVWGAGCAVVSLLVGLFLMDGVRTVDDVEIIAHRGAAGRAPENTMAAVRQAVEDGADWVEIDVQETVDGRIAVVHDSDLMKLAGENMKIWDATLDQLQQADIGSWFDPRFSDERVPILEDVLDAVRGEARLLIELKYYGHDQMLEQRVVDIVERMDMVEGVALMSLKQAGIEKAHSLRPDWSFGLLTSKTIGDMSSLEMDFLAVNMVTTSAGLIRRIHEAGKRVYVWTVNDRISMSRMVSLGVDGIITDEPELARTVLAERAELNFSERLLLHTAVLLGRPIPEKTYRDNSP